MSQDADALERAITLACWAHRGQRYPSPEPEPYILHPLRVVLAVPDSRAKMVVAHGVVYVAEGSNENNVGIDAFAATCATGGGTCTPLWHGKLGFYVPSDPVVAGGELWTADSLQNGPASLYAFGLPVPGSHAGSRPAARARAPGRQWVATGRPPRFLTAAAVAAGRSRN